MRPPPAAVLFAGVPKLKPALALVWFGVPKVKPPPAGAGVELARPKPVAGAAAAAGFWAPKEKPPEGLPKLNPPLILASESYRRTFKMVTFQSEPHELLAGHKC